MKYKNEIKKVTTEIKDIISNNEFKSYVEDNETSTIIVHFNEDNIYNDFSGKSLLSNEVYEYVDDAFALVNKKLKLNFNFVYSDSIKDDEKIQIEKAFKSHYALQIIQGKKQTHRTRLISYILLAFGILFLILYGLLIWLEGNFIFESIIEIVAWVFIWEAADTYFFLNHSNKKELVKNIIIFNASITHD